MRAITVMLWLAVFSVVAIGLVDTRIQSGSCEAKKGKDTKCE